MSLEVGRGELVALLGPNGAGKTTTVEILEGYRRADAGTVRVLGLDPAREGRALRPRIGLMLQEGGVDPRSTPREVLRLHARLFRDPEDPDALLADAGLEPRGRDPLPAAVGRASGSGWPWRWRCSGRPELLVLDEPTAGMDPAAKQATRERIAGLRAAGTTILLTTHELGDVERLADRVVVLDRGRIVAAGTPAELTGAGAPRVRFRLVGALDPAGAAALVAAVAPGARLVDDGADARYELRDLAVPARRRAGRRPRGVVRGARAAARRAPGRRREPRGAVPRARRARGRGVSGDEPRGRARERRRGGATAAGRRDPGTARGVAGDGRRAHGQELRLAARRGENLLAQFVIPVGTLVVLSALDLGGSDRAAPRWTAPCRRRSPSR